MNVYVGPTMFVHMKVWIPDFFFKYWVIHILRVLIWVQGGCISFLRIRCCSPPCESCWKGLPHLALWSCLTWKHQEGRFQCKFAAISILVVWLARQADLCYKFRESVSQCCDVPRLVLSLHSVQLFRPSLERCSSSSGSWSSLVLYPEICSERWEATSWPSVRWSTCWSSCLLQ